MRLARAIFVLASLVIGCGPGGGGGGGQGDCTPGPTASITITAGGFVPRAVCITPSGSVTFTNSDSVAHDLFPDNSAACAQLALSALGPGAVKTTLAFPTAEVCTFGDAAHQGVDAFQGTVAVSSAPVVGPGY